MVIHHENLDCTPLAQQRREHVRNLGEGGQLYQLKENSAMGASLFCRVSIVVNEFNTDPLSATHDFRASRKNPLFTMRISRLFARWGLVLLPEVKTLLTYFSGMSGWGGGQKATLAMQLLAPGFHADFYGFYAEKCSTPCKANYTVPAKEARLVQLVKTALMLATQCCVIDLHGKHNFEVWSKSVAG
eukprot:1158547-Pelagomonas_calceolata.AAC.5